MGEASPPASLSRETHVPQAEVDGFLLLIKDDKDGRLGN